jgi:flagellar assembly factor FliW
MRTSLLFPHYLIELNLMPWCNTTHFGRMEYTEGSGIAFPEGLPGFEAERDFVIVQQPEQHPLVFLQSLATPGLCFPALPARVIDPEYRPSLSDRDLELLDFSRPPAVGPDAVFLALIALHEDNPTANLLAPVVINLQTRTAAQCIDPEMRYSHRHALIAALEAAAS